MSCPGGWGGWGTYSLGGGIRKEPRSSASPDRRVSGVGDRVGVGEGGVARSDRGSLGRATEGPWVVFPWDLDG